MKIPFRSILSYVFLSFSLAWWIDAFSFERQIYPNIIFDTLDFQFNRVGISLFVAIFMRAFTQLIISIIIIIFDFECVLQYALNQLELWRLFVESILRQPR